MKYEIQNLDEITDSKEILSSKPHNFTIIFIYLTLAIIFAALIWSYFSEKEIVVNATGIVKPANQVTKISNTVAGSVVSINFKDDDKVKKGQVLYTIDHTTLDLQKTTYEKSLKDETDEISNLNKFKQSISSDKNLFNVDLSTERSYYYKFINYKQNCDNITTQLGSVSTQIKNLQDTISNYKLLLKSVNSNINYFTNSSSSYYNVYVDYQLNVNEYQSKIDDYQKILNTLKNNSNTQQSQIDTATTNLNDAKKDLDKYKNQSIGSIKTNIEQNQQKISELQSTQNIAQNSSSSTPASKEQYMTSTLVQIDDSIKTTQEKVDETNANLKNVIDNINFCIVKADIDGVINSETTVHKGDVLQSGSLVATILPKVNSNYSVDVYINNNDIGNIKNGKKVSLSLYALPSSEYGTIKSTLTSISADTKTNAKDGSSYYTATASINKNYLTNHKGEKSEIKSGMFCKVDIISRKEKMLYYVLEKLGLKT